MFESLEAQSNQHQFVKGNSVTLKMGAWYLARCTLAGLSPDDKVARPYQAVQGSKMMLKQAAQLQGLDGKVSLHHFFYAYQYEFEVGPEMTEAEVHAWLTQYQELVEQATAVS